jgi:hypothetical protein
MSEALKRAVQRAVLRMLAPLVKLLMDVGIGVGEFTSLAKAAYVRAAVEQARGAPGARSRPNATWISVVTGLTRVEVAAILARGESEPATNEIGRQRAERVLSGWWNDPDFQDEVGRPRALELKGGQASFASLCARYSGDPQFASILDELVRVKAVRRLSDDRVIAVSRTYATVRWEPEGVLEAGAELADHCATLLNNLKNPHRPLFARRVQNIQLDPRFAPMLIRDLTQQAGDLADSMDDALNDPHHKAKGANVDGALRLGIGFYVFEERSEATPAIPAREDKPRVRLTRAGKKKRGMRA